MTVFYFALGRLGSERMGSGMDRHGKPRRGLAECVCMARPIVIPG